MLHPKTVPPPSHPTVFVPAGHAAEPGLTSIVYQTARPFQAEKLLRFLQEAESWAGVEQAEGVVWVEADHRVVYALSERRTLVPAGMWRAALPRAQWMGVRPQSTGAAHPRFGDREQCLVFSGPELPEVELRARLDACLLDEEALQTDMASWSARPNPFPAVRLSVEAG